MSDRFDGPLVPYMSVEQFWVLGTSIYEGQFAVSSEGSDRSGACVPMLGVLEVVIR